MKVQFRKATEKDLKSIIDLCNECFEENTDLKAAIKIFRENENDDKQIYLVGEIDNKIIAHAKITIVPTIYEHMGTYAILNHVCVKPDFRRNNIATKMLDAITLICEQHGCKTMELWSKNFRMAAHGCYKKYGFVDQDAKYFIKELEK